MVDKFEKTMSTTISIATSPTRATSPPRSVRPLRVFSNRAGSLKGKEGEDKLTLKEKTYQMIK